MSGLFVIGVLLNAAASADTGFPIGTGETGAPPITTGETGDTDEPVDTDGPIDTGPIFTIPTADTAAPFCDTCGGAADLAGERGGTPCEEGCSTHGAGPALWLGLVPIVMARRRGAIARRRGRRSA